MAALQGAELRIYKKCNRISSSMTNVRIIISLKVKLNTVK